MNRRQFTQYLGALFATPALPAKATALPLTPVRPLHTYQHPYSWAAFTARIHDKASPALFKRQLALSDDMAQDVYDVLLRENVITPPDASGISKTFKPFQRSPEQMIRFKDTSSTPTDQPDPTQKPDLKLTEQTEEEAVDHCDSNSVNHDVQEFEDEPTILDDTTQSTAQDPQGADKLA